MSRIGRKPIPVPQGVKVAVDAGSGAVRVEGPKGKLSHTVPSGISVKSEAAVVTVDRSSDNRNVRALHGLTRSLIANMVHGVKDGFERKLEIVGIGYRCQLQGKSLQLALGYSHPVIFPLPEGIQAEVEKQVSITLRGADKALLGQTAALLRGLRKPDPYQQKGVRFTGEVLKKKAGKTGA